MIFSHSYFDILENYSSKSPKESLIIPYYIEWNYLDFKKTTTAFTFFSITSSASVKVFIASWNNKQTLIGLM